ncbi:SDR family oxidoreductase [Amycolatopsis sp. K13G38]|uniref:SDR family oxidoreductase n=1 Tax=Amycolatopsis acididurans TaxID=2724524 RepID=A0ABX1J965_9PSEU|nr:SDR family oxidoreductase [Amycolatopsis acididurans]NKQ56089.1 SDR family oxidoreductase [Amycolatopsis acididurans]
MRGLAGKIAIVTGAAGGIGSAAVARLLAEGCRVVAVDLDEDDIVKACGEVDGDRFVAVAADVSTPDGCAAYVKQAVHRFGAVHLFLNNAGIMGVRMPIVDMPVAEFDRIIAVNLRGVFLGLQAVIRQMIAQGEGGAVVNTSSAGALRPYVNSAGYGTSKNGGISLTKVAALENGSHGVRVNAVCPGSTATPLLTAAFGAEGAEKSGDHLPLARVASPDEIAALMVYLLSDDASYQTGGVYTVDGGLMLT